VKSKHYDPQITQIKKIDKLKPATNKQRPTAFVVQDKRFMIQAGDSRVEPDQNIPAHEKRRLKIYADDNDVVVKVLGIPEADYECIMVNGSWPEKSLVEGDIVLCADGRTAHAGDIVLIEENGRVRLGILAEPGRP
jgi:hypothetical protein